MKKIILAATFVTLTGVGLTTACAQGTKSSDKTTQTKKEAASKDTAEFDKQLNQMQEDVNKMQEQMTRIRQTQDPQERQRLLQEHWTTMQSAMVTMHGMGGLGMMGGGGHGMMGRGSSGMMGGSSGMGGGMMGWGSMSQYYSQLTPEQQKQRAYIVDQKLRMHQLMMEQMIERQQWISQPQGSTQK